MGHTFFASDDSGQEVNQIDPDLDQRMLSQEFYRVPELPTYHAAFDDTPSSSHSHRKKISHLPNTPNKPHTQHTARSSRAKKRTSYRGSRHCAGPPREEDLERLELSRPGMIVLDSPLSTGRTHRGQTGSSKSGQHDPLSIQNDRSGNLSRTLHIDTVDESEVEDQIVIGREKALGCSSSISEPFCCVKPTLSNRRALANFVLEKLDSAEPVNIDFFLENLGWKTFVNRKCHKKVHDHSPESNVGLYPVISVDDVWREVDLVEAQQAERKRSPTHENGNGLDPQLVSDRRPVSRTPSENIDNKSWDKEAAEMAALFIDPQSEVEDSPIANPTVVRFSPERSRIDVLRSGETRGHKTEARKGSALDQADKKSDSQSLALLEEDGQGTVIKNLVTPKKRKATSPLIFRGSSLVPPEMSPAVGYWNGRDGHTAVEFQTSLQLGQVISQPEPMRTLEPPRKRQRLSDEAQRKAPDVNLTRGRSVSTSAIIITKARGVSGCTTDTAIELVDDSDDETPEPIEQRSAVDSVKTTMAVLECALSPKTATPALAASSQETQKQVTCGTEPEAIEKGLSEKQIAEMSKELTYGIMMWKPWIQDQISQWVLQEMQIDDAKWTVVTRKVNERRTPNGTSFSIHDVKKRWMETEIPLSNKPGSSIKVADAQWDRQTIKALFDASMDEAKINWSLPLRHLPRGCQLSKDQLKKAWDERLKRGLLSRLHHK